MAELPKKRTLTKTILFKGIPEPEEIDKITNEFRIKHRCHSTTITPIVHPDGEINLLYTLYYTE